MKRTLIWLLAACTLVCIGIATAFWWIEHSYLSSRLSAISFAGQPVKLENAPSLSLLPPVLSLGQISWHGYVSGMEIYLSVREVQIAPDILSFMSSQPELRELVLDKPELRIIRKDAVAKGDVTNGGDAGWNLGIGRIVIQEGDVRYSDSVTDLRLTGLRLAGENARPKQEMSMQCDFGLHLAEHDGVAMHGNFALKTLMRYYAPNLTFRDGSATFTVLSPETLKFFSPCRAQFDGAVNLDTLESRIGKASIDVPLGRMEVAGEIAAGVFAGKGRLDMEMDSLSPWQGSLAVDSPFSIKGDKLELRGAEIGWGEFEAGADADVYFAPKGKQLTINGQWAEGTIKVELDAGKEGHNLNVMGRNISFGEVLRQFGVRGFSGGPTSLDVNVLFAGADIGAFKKSAIGKGKIECGRLELEPFGEVSMLLPLLGRTGRMLPKVLENFKTYINVGNGKITFAPISGTGPDFGLKGRVAVNILKDSLAGELLFDLLGLSLPLSFSGPLGHPEFRIMPDAFRRQ